MSKIASAPMTAAVPPDLPVKSLNDFIALAKEKPGKLNFSSAGLASTTFLSAELLKQGAGIDIMHVPYKGTPEATTAVVRGDVQMYFTPIPMAQELSAAGKVRPIAINSNQRSAQLPDVPTVKETVPSYDYDFVVLRRFSRRPTRRARSSTRSARILPRSSSFPTWSRSCRRRVPPPRRLLRQRSTLSSKKRRNSTQRFSAMRASADSETRIGCVRGRPCR